jgi:hypothetical protein
VTTRDRIVIMVVLALAAVGAGWMFVVSPKRSEASSLNAQISTEQSQLTAAQGQVAAGENARHQFAGQYAELAKLGEAVPPDDDVPSLIYQVQSAAAASHVSFRGLQLASAGASSSSSSTSSTGQTTTTQLPPGAAVGAAGLPTEQFTITLSGNYFDLSTFFNKLEGFVSPDNGTLMIRGRLMSINAISLVPGPTGFPQITASVSATTYIVPPTEGTFGGATPAGPAPTTQAQASTSGSSTSTTPPTAAVTPVLR